jgi:hypothetical protein
MNEPTVTLVIGFESEHRRQSWRCRASPDTLRTIVENAMQLRPRLSAVGLRRARWQLAAAAQTLAEAVTDLDQRESS